ncbi:MAG TPA: hypothetical protein VGR93_11155 [Candidatus Acidoferrales bacterium]|nr:hypothetical protein [Candidatus Acidoferrales bacterium]
MKLRLTVIVAVFFTFAIGSVRTALAAPPKDACSLLTSAQVSSVLGFSAKPGRIISTDTTVCDWPVASLSKMTAKDTKEIEVKILDADSWAMIAPAASGAAQVKGIGDIAAYLGPPTLMTLYVKKGTTEFDVNVHGFPLDQVKAKEKTLAQDILAKL